MTADPGELGSAVSVSFGLRPFLDACPGRTSKNKQERPLPYVLDSLCHSAEVIDSPMLAGENAPTAPSPSGKAEVCKY
jgi:hypothetical protein